MLLAKLIWCVCVKTLWLLRCCYCVFRCVRSRESRCCSFTTATGNPECRVSSRSQTSYICRHHHAFTHPLAPSRSPFNSHRNAASPPLPQNRNAVCRYNHRRAKSFGGNFTHSHIRRPCHDRRSTRIETRYRQSATRETG